MYLRENNDEILDFVLELSDDSAKYSRIYPVDRSFLESRLDRILSTDAKYFVFFNLDILPNLYVGRLFACLPEVWQKLSFNDILEMAENFTNVQAYFKLILFTYKYVEIDIISSVISTKQVKYSHYISDHIKSYLELQWNNLIKSESDYEDFSDGFIDVDYNEWLHIKQRFLLDKRVKPALKEYGDLKGYIQEITKAMNNGGNILN